MPNFTSVTFNRLKDEIESYLKAEHNKANILFSPASPYGQILSVVENLHQLSILYLKNAINQFDLGLANNVNERVIKNTAILAGHIPFRAISASGTLKFVVKGGIDLDKELPSGTISIQNKLTLKNNTNSLFYATNTGGVKLDFNVRMTPSFFIPIVQGQWEKVTFTGTGAPLQTYVVQDKGNKEIENFNIDVKVNGQTWQIKKSVYDLLPDEQACVVRTGFNSGVDVIFGNGGFGAIPPLASSIAVRYLSTDGSAGNIYRRTLNDWKAIDDIFDINGNNVDIEKIFDIEIYNDINFGNDREDYRFTKSLLPIASNNFVLALPQQYAYELKRLGVFTYVNATEKNGTIFIFLVPDITLFKRDDENYFSIPIKNTTAGSTTTTSAFELDSYERQKIVSYLKSSGVIQLTKKFIIKTPTLSFYAMNVWIITYSDATFDAVKAQIVNVVSEYFLNFNKMDRIPKSEMIKLISNLRDVHSVKVEFVCKKNEDYHIEGIKSLQGLASFNASKFFKDPSLSGSKYDPTKTIGLDPYLGDILFEASELPVMRGNWYDRSGNYFADENPVASSNMTSVNVFNKGQVDAKNRFSI
jgi:hypothetical protein